MGGKNARTNAGLCRVESSAPESSREQSLASNLPRVARELNLRETLPKRGCMSWGGGRGERFPAVSSSISRGMGEGGRVKRGHGKLPMSRARWGDLCVMTNTNKYVMRYFKAIKLGTRRSLLAAIASTAFQPRDLIFDPQARSRPMPAEGGRGEEGRVKGKGHLEGREASRGVGKRGGREKREKI